MESDPLLQKPRMTLVFSRLRASLGVAVAVELGFHLQNHAARG